MNKKGFTLIELLAVIVILAIIALIATPIVLNIINDAKQESGLRSADFYLDAVELSIAQATLEGQNITDGTYNILENGNICLEEYDRTNKKCTDGNDSDTDVEELKVEVKGKTPEDGTITIANGKIDEMSLILNEKVIEKNDKGELVYVTRLNEVCTYISGTEKSVGAKYSCNLGDGERFFYVLEVGTNRIANSTLKEDEVALILSGNYDETMQSWCKSGINNSCNADGLTLKLNEIASSWIKILKNQIVLPSIYQVALADGKDYTNDLLKISNDNAWLYNWPENKNYGGEQPNPPYAYWTSTPQLNSETGAITVDFDGNISGYPVSAGGEYGLRPVVNLKI